MAPCRGEPGRNRSGQLRDEASVSSDRRSTPVTLLTPVIESNIKSNME